MESWLANERLEIESALEAALPPASEPPVRLHQAMRYSVLGGGKRLRPLLCRAAAEAVRGTAVPEAMAPACAVEMVHAYSLIHDDLPALDNDDLRRGRPTCHKAFGEAMAILAGDALLTLAFGQLSSLPAAMVAPALRELAEAAGTPGGMVAGQVEDIESERAGAADPAETVRRIHARKTGAMIRASVLLGGLAAGAEPQSLERLGAFGADIGLAFQIVDDMLDITGAPHHLGKTAGKDAAQSKLTWPAVFGMPASRVEARVLAGRAQEHLQPFGRSAQPLCALAARMVERDW